jgi:hypothetical protein
MTPTTPVWRLTLPFAAMGLGMAFIWSPLAATATRNLPASLAGAGSGVYNATRQVGSVLGSASIAGFMTWCLSHELPGMPKDALRGEGAVTQLPPFLHEPFSTAMSISMLLPAFIALIGIVAAMFMAGMRRKSMATGAVGARGIQHDDSRVTDVIPAIDDGDYPDDDDDEYVEFLLEPPVYVPPVYVPPHVDESDTEPLPTRAHAAAGELVQLRSKDVYETLFHEPPEQWLPSAADSIGTAHNGFHVDHESMFPDLPDEQAGGRHAASDPDLDTGGSGRHSRSTGD